MKQTYRVVAGLIAAGVLVQAGAIAAGWFTALHDVDNGLVIDKNYDGNAFHSVHGFVGFNIMPLLGLILLIVSFFAAKSVPGARKWAGIVFGLIILQVRPGAVRLQRPGPRRAARHQRPRRPRHRRPRLDAHPRGPPGPGERGGAVDVPPQSTGSTSPQSSRPVLTSSAAGGGRSCPRTVAVLLLAGARLVLVDDLVPSTYSVMDMGYPDSGGGPAHAHVHGAAGRSVADLTGPADRHSRRRRSPGRPRSRSFALASGEQVEGYTLNGTSPGPAIRGAPGRPGPGARCPTSTCPRASPCTGTASTCPTPRTASPGSPRTPSAGQEPRLPVRRAGRRHVLVPLPPGLRRAGAAAGCSARSSSCRRTASDERRTSSAPVHTYSGRRTVAGRTGITTVDADAGHQVRVRLVNTDNGPLRSWVSGGAVPVAAVDGRDLHGPTDVRGTGRAGRPPGPDGPARDRARPGRPGRRDRRRRRATRRRRAEPGPSPRSRSTC